MPDRPRPTPPPAKPLDQAKISRILGSTTEPAAPTPAGKVAQYLREKGEASAELPQPAPGGKKREKKPGQLVAYKCGHTRGVKDFTGTDCPACRNRQRQEKNAARRAEALADRQPPHSKAPTLADTGRLPAGSTKRLTWNGNEWYGVLDVPGCPGAFECRAGTERECCHGLDRCYREYLAARAAE